MIIGITGKSGSGKNYFAETLLQNNPNLVHVDIDIIGHKAFEIQEVKNRLIETFGSVDRKEIADLIFNNRNVYDKFVDITWVYMQGMIDKIINDKEKDYILNWILLPKSKYFNMCDINYLIKRDEEERIKSALKRDGITINQMCDRDKNSIEYNENDFDFVIINKGGVI